MDDFAPGSFDPGRFDSGRFDASRFLRDNWQRQPLLIRNPWTAWTNPLEPDELAGLACEEGVESRLVRHTDAGLLLEHGPFAEARFGQLTGAPWTLLVQAADIHVPAVAALLASFRFIPNWRIDDVMVSYASDGGGVGAHFDQYDVFLIQGLGQRRWRIGARCDDTTPLVPNADLRLIDDFAATDEWLLDPGDILYLPPGIAHDGIAVGDDCMTYSIGFRAPARAELIAQWGEQLVADLPDDDRYSDPGLAPQSNPGEISAGAIAALHAMITEKLQDEAAFARWFGAYASTPKYPEVDWRPEVAVTLPQLRAALATGVPLLRNPASRFAFIRAGNAIALFVDGACFDCVGPAARLAEQIAAHDRLILAADLSPPATALLLDLLNQGSVAFDEDSSDDD